MLINVIGFHHCMGYIVGGGIHIRNAAAAVSAFHPQFIRVKLIEAALHWHLICGWGSK